MKRLNKILLGAGFTALLLITWGLAVNSPPPTQKQAALIAQANTLISDKIYIRTIALLEEAAGYKGDKTPEAESLLKTVYLELMGQGGMRDKYIALLEKQMSRPDAPAEVFKEAAGFYIGINKLPEALEVLKNGIEKLNDENLIAYYEARRYAFHLNMAVYEDVTAIVNGRIQVYENGLWGLAGSDGSLIIPCRYDKISNYSNARTIVVKGKEIFAVDDNNNRIAVLHETASDIGNYGNDRVGILTGEGWKRATGDFIVGTAVFEQIGMYSGGYAAAMQGGKWGVVDIGTEWLLPAEYDEIIVDELGRAYAQGAVFARIGGKVLLFVNGKQSKDSYEDARPFSNNGWAAVKKNGKWGFINTSGEVTIDYQFKDALSFGRHLAAVKQDEFWGYINVYGNMVIEPAFLQAKSFDGSDAPVLTERGWLFFTLYEYRKGAGL